MCVLIIQGTEDLHEVGRTRKGAAHVLGYIQGGFLELGEFS